MLSMGHSGIPRGRRGRTHLAAMVAGLGFVVAGLLLGLGATYTHLARALPIRELLVHSRIIPAVVSLGIGCALILAPHLWQIRPRISEARRWSIKRRSWQTT